MFEKKLPTDSYFTPSDNRGFSIIELMVVVGIFTLISGVLLGNYPLFSHKISVQNLAHQIALEIRQAQVFGLSVKEARPGCLEGTINCFPAYGVYFSALDRGSFILFNDSNNNKKYDFAAQDCSSPSNTECIEKISIASGDNIRDICGTDSSGQQKCASLLGQLDYLNIVFVRPDPDANIIGTAPGGDTLYSSAEISVEPPKKDFCRIIKVWSTGQISVPELCP